jgi:hypothetical protein
VDTWNVIVFIIDYELAGEDLKGFFLSSKCICGRCLKRQVSKILSLKIVHNYFTDKTDVSISLENESFL